MFQLSGLVFAESGAVDAADPNIRHKDVTNGNARAAAAAHTDRVPIVKDQNVGYWKDRECQMLKGAGLIDFSGMADADGFLPRSETEDGVHFSADAYNSWRRILDASLCLQSNR